MGFAIRDPFMHAFLTDYIAFHHEARNSYGIGVGHTFQVLPLTVDRHVVQPNDDRSYR